MPRYKQFEGEKNDYKKKQQRIPQKIVRYFPLIPRLQRLFMSSKTASLMRWHVEGRIDDGKMRHPADSLVWKNFDTLYPKFASEPRNVRLGLAADGFNPFKAMNVAHSSWPVIVMPYNLPPWLCMKQPHMMMILLIDGPSSPGNNIDVYLRLLVDELIELWENGVQTYDAETNQMFQLHAVLLWTINDFPAYANLSGWSTKGVLACPCCNIRTRHRYLKNGRKICYMGHRRWLNASHKFRKDAASFDGTSEFEPCPTRLSGANVLRQLGPKHQPTNRQKKTRKGKKKKDNEEDHNWRKRSIFFELPHWEHNLIRHNLDVMHIEKNMCDNVLWTILNVDGKGKDNLNARRDLQDMGIRKALHPKKGVGNRQLRSKTLEPDGLDRLQSQIALTLCHLERIFPPSFFDIMEHLPIHLAEEAKIAGPVQYRWMYSIESHPEGSIAEGYLVEECMTFCLRYLDDVESKLNRPIRNYDVSDNPGILLGHALGKGKGFALDNTSWVQPHRYVLFNTAAVVPYREEYHDFIKRSHRRLKDFDVDRCHNDEFPRWFNSPVEELLAIKNVVLSDEIKTLALGPSKKATRFNGYIINGTRYHTRSREWRRKTQNSGVMVKAKTCSYASTRDMNPVEGEVAYYGYVTDIIELYYSYDRRYVLFMCD
ncbi:uncharacterized protein LOC114294835 [Camellia sinensis]|uniref:uncharacterized protein LOC114294835 n=1 Tax=Camellia sinensis TaxID=4442 RepID=UPI0010360730|nr:uncharacterized protein LOC114294835 [Camellia sinensis]